MKKALFGLATLFVFIGLTSSYVASTEKVESEQHPDNLSDTETHNENHTEHDHEHSHNDREIKDSGLLSLFVETFRSMFG